VDALRTNLQTVQTRIAAMPGLRMSTLEATYLAWIDCRGCGLANPLAAFEAAGVGLYDGADFGAPGFVRLNFACPPAMLDEALTRMARALAHR
jgi:cystathionine beta-lyase